jgi:hypothetical protein
LGGGGKDKKKSVPCAGGPRAAKRSALIKGCGAEFRIPTLGKKLEGWTPAARLPTEVESLSNRVKGVAHVGVLSCCVLNVHLGSFNID